MLAVDECPICLENFTEARAPHAIMECGHIFCGPCLESLSPQRCSFCKVVFRTYRRIFLPVNVPSSPLAASSNQPEFTQSLEPLSKRLVDLYKEGIDIEDGALRSVSDGDLNIFENWEEEILSWRRRCGDDGGRELQNLKNRLKLHVKTMRKLATAEEREIHQRVLNSRLESDLRAEKARVAWMNFPDPEHKQLTLRVLCDICNSEITGLRYKCWSCSDFDLCDTCFPRGILAHGDDHTFVHLGRRGGNTRPPSQVGGDVAVVDTAGNPSGKTAHVATCNLCRSPIVGDRYKCADCPDYDTCQRCFGATEELHSMHSFIRITNPADYINRKLTAPPRAPSHPAFCDSCEIRIPASMPRYKCTHPSCPDYDLCSNCEALPEPVHPRQHNMLKMHVPGLPNQFQSRPQRSVVR